MGAAAINCQFLVENGVNLPLGFVWIFESDLINFGVSLYFFDQIRRI